MWSLIVVIFAVIGAYVIIPVLLSVVGMLIIPILVIGALVSAPFVIGYLAGRMNKKKEEKED